MPTVPGGNPIALGRVEVATPGTPVPILQNFTAVDTAAERKTNTISGRLGAAAITVQSDPENTAYPATHYLYVGKVGMVIATGVGVLAKLQPGQSTTIGDGAIPGNIFNLADIVLDANTADAGGYVSAVRR